MSVIAAPELTSLQLRTPHEPESAPEIPHIPHVPHHDPAPVRIPQFDEDDGPGLPEKQTLITGLMRKLTVGNAPLVGSYIRKSSVICIDVGTSCTKIQIDDHPVEFIPTYITYDSMNKVVAFGKRSKRSWGIDTENMKVYAPMQDGIVHDSNHMEKFIAIVLEHYCQKYNLTLTTPRVLCAAPTQATNANKKSLCMVFRKVLPKAAEILVTDEAKAAVVGTVKNTNSPFGIPVADFGGGTTDIAVLMSNDLVKNRCVIGGGRAMNDAIIQIVRDRMHMGIGEATAEKIKEEIGYAVLPDEPVPDCKFFGKRFLNDRLDLPEESYISAELVHEALQKPLSEIYRGMREMIAELPPEISKYIRRSGWYLSGGGANLKNLGLGIQNQIKIFTTPNEKPAEAVLNGLKRMAEEQYLKDLMTEDPLAR